MTELYKRERITRVIIIIYYLFIGGGNNAEKEYKDKLNSKKTMYSQL